MKQLKFNYNLVPLILNGSKTVTWRLFDDKDLQVGDEMEFLNSDTGRKFAQATILEMSMKPISQITTTDREGHDLVGEGQQLIKHYETLYKKSISPDDEIKIIKFKITKKTA